MREKRGSHKMYMHFRSKYANYWNYKKKECKYNEHDRHIQIYLSIYLSFHRTRTLY